MIISEELTQALDDALERGDDDAQNQSISELRRDLIQRLALPRLRNHLDAEDVVQEAFHLFYSVAIVKEFTAREMVGQLITLLGGGKDSRGRRIPGLLEKYAAKQTKQHMQTIDAETLEGLPAQEPATGSAGDLTYALRQSLAKIKLSCARETAEAILDYAETHGDAGGIAFSRPQIIPSSKVVAFFRVHLGIRRLAAVAERLRRTRVMDVLRECNVRLYHGEALSREELIDRAKALREKSELLRQDPTSRETVEALAKFYEKALAERDGNEIETEALLTKRSLRFRLDEGLSHHLQCRMHTSQNTARKRFDRARALLRRCLLEEQMMR